MASGSQDKTIKIWNSLDGSLIRTLTGHTDAVFSLAVLRNGFLASGGGFDDCTIKIWNTHTGSLERTLTGHSEGVTSLALLKNGNLATGDGYGTVNIWDTNTGSLLRTFASPNFFSIKLATLKNGDLGNLICLYMLIVYFVSKLFGLAKAGGREDMAISIWNADKGELVKNIIGHEDYIYSLVVLPNGYLASGSGDSKIKIWNASNDDRCLVGTIDTDKTGSITSLAVLKNGSFLASGCFKEVQIWNMT